MMGRRLVVLALVLALFSPASADAVTLWPAVSTTVGLPAFFTQQGDMPLPAAVGFTSTATETIAQATVPLGVTGGDARLQMEVYESGDEVPGIGSTTTYRPSADFLNEGSTWVRQNLSTTNLYQSIDEATVNDNDWIGYLGPQQNSGSYGFNVDSGAWPTSQRVTGGFVRIRANRQDTTGRLRVSYFDGIASIPLGTITVTDRKANYDVPFPAVNPGTGYPWTRDEIRAFASTSAVLLTPVNVNKQKPLRVYQAYLSLDWIPEERVAVGVIDVSNQDPGTETTFDLRLPNSGTGDWSKASAQSYTIVITRTDGFGQAAWRFLTESAPTSEALLRPDQNVGLPVESYSPLFDSSGLVSAMGSQIAGRAQTIYLTRSDAAVSVDGQPYEVLLPNLLGDFQIQKLTPTASGNYSMVRALVADLSFGDPLLAGAEATITVRKVSDGTQVGGSATVALADLIQTPQLGMTYAGAVGNSQYIAAPMYLLEAELSSPAALTNGTAYYLQIEDPDSAIALTVAQYGDGEDATVGVSTYGGTAQAAATGAFGSFDTDVSSDAPATVSVTPTAPTGLTATQETEANDPDLEAAGCTVPTTERISLDWTPTALGSDFGRYELQRSDDDAGYVDIAEGTDEDSETYPDPESVRGALASYRIRAVRGGDWIPSAWSSTATATANPYGSEVVFAAAWLAEALAVNRESEIEWPQPNNDATLQLAGRDFQIRFQEAEARGDGGSEGFDIPVIVYYGFPGQNQPTPDGRAAFAPLIDFLRTYVPYMTCLFADGGRWYGRATLDPASISNSPDAAGNYTATINMLVTQATPTPVPIPSAGS